MWCTAAYIGSDGGINSQIGTIIIQGNSFEFKTAILHVMYMQFMIIIINIIGLLAAVSNLTTGELISGRSILLSWVAPFTLNVTNVEPDITYCVDTYVAMGGMTLCHIQSTCDIIITVYNVIFNEGEVTPCDTVSVTVTPVDGLQNNGTRRNISSINLFQSIYLYLVMTIASYNIITEPPTIQYCLLKFD